MCNYNLTQVKFNQSPQAQRNFHLLGKRRRRKREEEEEKEKRGEKGILERVSLLNSTELVYNEMVGIFNFRL